MQVSVEKTKGLGRKMTVQLSSDEFESAFLQKLESLAKTTKMAGFRPGKVPLKVIRQRYGAGVRHEIMSDLIQRSYSEALRQENLSPAGMPHIESEPPKAGEDMQFTAEFEIYPEFTLADLSKIKVVSAKVDIDDKDVESTIEKLRKQRAEWSPVERAAAKGDQVTIDFVGTIDGEEFEGGKGQDVPLELGSGQMIDGFESQLEGISAGERRDLKVKFPKDYQQESLQAKKAIFATSCKTVAEQKLPELNEEFARSFGAEDGSIETLTLKIKDHLQHESDQHVKAYAKEQVMDGLIGIHKVDLPNVMVDSEVVELQKQAAHRLGLKDIDINNLPRDGFEERARRRVHLGLVVGKLTEEAKMKPDQEKVRELMAQSLAGYENPEQVLQQYLNNREAMQHFQSIALEEQVVEYVIEQAKVTEKSMTFDELVSRGQA